MNGKYLYNNIRGLAKEKGIKMSELDKPYGPGYISRMQNNGISKLDIGIVYRASKLLGVAMEDLIDKDLVKEARRTEIQAEIKRLQEELEKIG